MIPSAKARATRRGANLSPVTLGELLPRVTTKPLIASSNDCARRDLVWRRFRLNRVVGFDDDYMTAKWRRRFDRIARAQNGKRWR